MHEFPEAVFLGVDMESQLRDEEVWSARLEKGIKIAITFDLTIGSPLNFCTSFWKPFSLELLWNRNSVTRRYGWPELSNGAK